jgi:hypothetical protein
MNNDTIPEKQFNEVLKILKDTNKVANCCMETIEKNNHNIQKQGEIINQINVNVDNIEYNLKISEYIIRGIKSFNRNVQNIFLNKDNILANTKSEPEFYIKNNSNNISTKISTIEIQDKSKMSEINKQLYELQHTLTNINECTQEQNNILKQQNILLNNTNDKIGDVQMRLIQLNNRVKDII